MIDAPAAPRVRPQEAPTCAAPGARDATPRASRRALRRALRRLPLALAGAALALGAWTAPAVAQRVYVTNGNQQFGTVDLATGAFQQIGPTLAVGVQGFAAAPNGLLWTLAFSGDLATIDPRTGLPSTVGPTGLADCTTPQSPCGPNSVNTLVGLGGTIYVTDLQNTLYRVDPLTGAATRVGATGIPGVPFAPLSENRDGTINIYDQALLGVGDWLYATFDVGTLDPEAGVITPVIAPGLYRIDPVTGAATLVGSIPFGLGAVANVGGTIYAFNDAEAQILTLDLATAQTRVVGTFDPAVTGVVSAAIFLPTTVPEPTSLALLGVGLAGVGACRRRARRR